MYPKNAAGVEVVLLREASAAPRYAFLRTFLYTKGDMLMRKKNPVPPRAPHKFPPSRPPIFRKRDIRSPSPDAAPLPTVPPTSIPPKFRRSCLIPISPGPPPPDAVARARPFPSPVSPAPPLDLPIHKPDASRPPTPRGSSTVPLPSKPLRCQLLPLPNSEQGKF